MCVEEFELCLKPRGIIWRAHLAYVLSSGVHSAHHHLLDGNGFCQVLDTQTNTLTHDERCPGRAKDRQNNLNISNKHKQAAYCYSYCPVKQWCPHKCIDMKSSGERSEVTDPRTHIHTHTLYKLFCTKVFPTHGGWPESRSAYFSWGRITLHLHCPLMLLTSPRASPNSLSWAFSIFIFYLFPAETEAAFRMEGQIPCHSNEMWHGQSCWHDLAHMPSNCVTTIHFGSIWCETSHCNLIN